MIYNIEDPLLDNYLYNYEEIPDWYKDNKYIKIGYRRWNMTNKYYIKSLFTWHNETLNIWSHIIGTLLFIILSLITFKYYLLNTYIGDIVSISLFLFSCITCFLLSSLMHCFYPKSENCCNCLLLGDYYGIIFLILCSYNIFLYYLFYCNYNIQKYYYIIINGLAIINFILLKVLNNKKYHIYKLLILISFILSIFVPTIHRYIYYTNIEPDEFKEEIEYYSISLCIYFLAFLFYLTKIPESIYTYKFVNYFTSHTIFHILIVIATTINFHGIMNLHILFKTIYCKNETLLLN